LSSAHNDPGMTDTRIRAQKKAQQIHCNLPQTLSMTQ
jgi:hypothetical protein